MTPMLSEPYRAAVEAAAEAIWQAEHKRAGNSGTRRIAWTENSEEHMERYRFLARHALADVLAKAAELGWVMVPKEATEEMRDRACANFDRVGVQTVIPSLLWMETWDAMLAAAPVFGEE